MQNETHKFTYGLMTQKFNWLILKSNDDFWHFIDLKIN